MSDSLFRFEFCNKSIDEEILPSDIQTLAAPPLRSWEQALLYFYEYLANQANYKPLLLKAYECLPEGDNLIFRRANVKYADN